MTDFKSTEERIAFYLKQMKKAMPEIRRQTKVYEEAIKSGKSNKQSTTPSQGTSKTYHV